LSGVNTNETSDINKIQDNLDAIQKQLGCISSQLADLQASINQIELQVNLTQLSACETYINHDFVTYTYLVADASKFQSDLKNTTDGNLHNFFTKTEPDHWGICDLSINTALFATGGNKQSTWNAYLPTAHKYSNVFFPSDINNMQKFLAYYASLQYQQSVLRSDYYNYQINILKKDATKEEIDSEKSFAQYQMIGSVNSSCSLQGSIDKWDIIGYATNFCQVQMNIAKVWPQTIFSDEVALCTNKSCGDLYNPLLNGIAIVAVPASLGIFFPPFTPFTPSSSPFSVLPPSGMTCRDGLCFYPNISPNTLANSCIAAGDKSNCSYTMPTTLANNTLDNFNNYTPTTLMPSNTETYWTRLAKREGVATSEQLVPLSTKPDALNSVAPFLSSWLNYSNGAPDPKSPTWTLLHSSTTLSSNFKQDKQTTCFTQPDTHITQCQTINWNTDSVSISNGLYNPGYNFTPCNYTTNTCDGGSFPSTPAAAYLLQRSWNAGYTATPKQDAPPQQDAPIKPVQPSPPFLGPTPLGPVQ